MKRTALNDLRAKSADELQSMAKELREQLLKSRFSSAMEGKRLGLQYRGTRRQIARIETLIAQKAKAR